MEPTTYHSKKAQTKKENSRKQIGLTSEILSTSCGSRKKSLKQNSIIKPSFVLLKNVNHGGKEKHNYCLTTPRGKHLAPQTQHKKFAAFRKLQVGLYDILDKSSVPTLKKSFQIPNVGALLEKEKKDTAEGGTTEVDSCRRAEGCSGELEPGQTNSGCDIRKSGNGAKSSKFLALSDQSLFATFIEPNHENTVMDLCLSKTDEETKESFSVLVSDAEKWNTKRFEPIEKCMESGSQMVKGTEDGQDVETKLSGGSRETVIGDVIQPHSLNSISVSEKGLLQNREIIPALNSSAFSETSISRMILTDEKPHQEDLCDVSEPVSTLSEIDLKLGIQTLTSNTSEIKLPIKEMMGLCLNTLTEKIHQAPMILEEEESNTRDSNENRGSFYFLLKSNEIRCDEALVCVAYEEESGNVPYGGGLSGSLSGQNYPDDDGGSGGAFLHTEIEKATMSVEDKEVNFFSNEKETMDCPPAGEDISVGEMFGSLVKLLGSPSVNQKKSRFRKLTELEDSSNAKMCEGSDARLSSKRKKEDRTMYLDCRTKQKPIPRLWLSQEQSRMKVMKALTETLQKRLNVSPDLDVQKNIASKIAKKVEMEIFRHFGCVDRLYKNKYRSLLFNLKSTDNQLFHKLMLRKISPRRLVQMSSLEMASKELAEWRAKNNKHELEMIEKEQRDMPGRCSEKFTHKGIVEIYREVEIDVASDEIIESSLLEGPSLVGSNQISELAADNEPARYKFTFNQEPNPSQILHPNTVCSEVDKTAQDEGSTANRNRQVPKRSRYPVIWNGLIQMFSVKQFVAKAYPVSGFGSHLSQALPTVLQSQGYILPNDVWAYVDSIWPAKREEMGVIQFRPSLSRDFSSYHILYTYLNNRQRYGVVESNQMEIFLVPLPAYQLVPSQFHPVGGPGLHRCHPALLLGLILPKRTLLDRLKTSRDLPPRAKKKKVISKVNPENSCFTLPSHLQVDVGQDQTPQPLWTGGLTSLPKQEELTVDSLLGLIEQLKRDIVHSVPSTSCQQDARDEVNQPFLTADSASTGEQLGNLTLEMLGPPPCQNKEERQFSIDPPPSDFCSMLGPLLPSGVLHPDQHGIHMAYGAQGTFENLLFPSVFCAEAMAPVEECQAQLSPQIPYTNTVGEHNSSVQETLSLIQTMMQSNIQNLEDQSCSLLTQEMISTLSQIPAGTESFPVQQDGGHHLGPNLRSWESDRCYGGSLKL